MNNRRLLIAPVFHFMHPVEKDRKTSQVDKKLCQLQLSKLHELTCQILTNRSILLIDWLNFRVRDQFEIKMLIARGHSDINTTLSVIMSLFCCRFLCLCISLSRCLCQFFLALFPVCLPAFFTIIFSPSSRPDIFLLSDFLR